MTNERKVLLKMFGLGVAILSISYLVTAVVINVVFFAGFMIAANPLFQMVMFVGTSSLLIVRNEQRFEELKEKHFFYTDPRMRFLAEYVTDADIDTAIRVALARASLLLSQVHGVRDHAKRKGVLTGNLRVQITMRATVASKIEASLTRAAAIWKDAAPGSRDTVIRLVGIHAPRIDLLQRWFIALEAALSDAEI